MDDPRPDLVNDTAEWNWFLKRACEIDLDLAYILHGFRCAGARLNKTNGGYVMRPEFNKNSLWQNQQDYDRDKKQWLISCTKEIIELLNKLGGD
jgi:hypothetical protein